MNPEPSKTILVVDDDAIILVALRETLSLEGFKVITAPGAKQAIELIPDNDFAIIISDQRMPEMTGLEFLSQVKVTCPLASRILITGVLSLSTIIDSVNKGEIFRFIAKPWMREELIATIHNAYQRYKLLFANKQLQKNTLSLNEELSEANRNLNAKIAILKETNLKLDHANDNLSRNFEHSLDLCYRLIDAFHPLLGKETKSIVDLCQLMINTGHFPETDAHVLKVSAWLKNIGLIGVSREILLRYRNDIENLSDEELRLIHNAPVVAQTLSGFVDHLKDVGQTLRSQYERWDGSGFPDGLAGNLIPRMANYLAVATFYVESGKNREEATELIINHSGSYFEPEAVRLFMKATKPIKLPNQVKEILFRELEAGMTLAKGIYSQSGILLVPEGRKLSESVISKIVHYNQSNPIEQRILINA